MQQAINRLRWLPGEQRNPNQLPNMNKPLPTPREQLPQRKKSRRSSKSPRPSPMNSPIPIISVDDSACYPDSDYPQCLSVSSAPAVSRRASFHPNFIPGRLAPRRMHMTVQHARPTSPRPSHPPPPLPTPREIRTSVMRFLEQQEREMRLEVQRVGSEIRDLKRCVRAVKREQAQIQARSQFRSAGLGLSHGHGHGHAEAQMRGARFVPEFESGSGSDADTEEVNVVVVSAD